MITIHNLLKKFGSKTAVQIPELVIGEKAVIGLVGNNGAGKTTLFRLILDLSEATEGYVEIEGRNVVQDESWKNFTGTFIDSGFLIEYLTPIEYWEFIAKMNHINIDTVKNMCEHYAHFLPEENDLRHTYIRELSAGSKQKVGIVGALLHTPKLVLLDEPFNFLDPTSQSVLKRLLLEYVEANEATIIVSSHNVNHVADISKRVLLMEKGGIIRDMDKSDSNIAEELNAYFEVDDND